MSRVVNDTVLASLQKILDTVSAMQPLSDAGSPEAGAGHDAWMKQFDRLEDLERTAYVCVLPALPSEVSEMLGRVKDKIREMQGH
jgi:hypothetical protein